MNTTVNQTSSTVSSLANATNVAIIFIVLVPLIVLIILLAKKKLTIIQAVTILLAGGLETFIGGAAIAYGALGLAIVPVGSIEFRLLYLVAGMLVIIFSAYTIIETLQSKSKKRKIRKNGRRSK
ncbi:MAG: hypothetical protein M1286_00195 [Candidatus Marsarchaeota archaeon]|nr:hypothetical protein [Candidatus Marsarchaeota archaeon]